MRHYTRWAIQEVIGWQEFEDICTVFLFSQHDYKHIRQAGRVGDQGRDAVIILDTQEQIVFAYSKEQAPLSGSRAKFFRDYDRWRGRGLHQFVFVSSQDLGTSKIDLPKKLDDPPVVVYDITDLLLFLDYTPEGNDVKRHHGIELSGAIEMSRVEEGKVPLPARRFSVLSLSDVSHAAAKRYTADILITAGLPRESVRAIVAGAVGEFRSAELFRNAITRSYWEGQPTHAVWLFVYQSLDDVPQANWICRCLWLSPDLTGSGRPPPLQGNDSIDGTTIDWNEKYQARSQFAAEHTLSQADFLAQLDSVMAALEPEVATVLKLHEGHQQGKMTVDAYVAGMSAAEPRIRTLYQHSGNLGFAPTTCHRLSQSFQQLMAAAHNVVLPFSERGLATWPQRNRDYLVRDAIETLEGEIDRLKIERQRLS